MNSLLKFGLNASTDLLDRVMTRQIHQQLSLSAAQPLSPSALITPEQAIETLYIHIPFCHTLCRFCSFHKVTFNEALARDYFYALRQEIRFILDKGYRFHRVYIGGGTTTILEDELIKTIEYIRSNTDIREVSCESDPLYFRHAGASALQGLVDRMSIGVQSFDDKLLKATGRFEKFGSGLQQAEAIARAIELFPTINLDMMFGFAEQSAQSLIWDLEQAMRLKPAQITTYPLTTGSGKLKKKSAKLAGDPHQLFQLFQTAKQTLAPAYDMEYPWTYSLRQEIPVAHKYVLDGESCFGIGSGAFGRSGQDFQLSNFNVRGYIEQVGKQQSGACFHTTMSEKSLEQHHLMIMMGRGYFDEAQFKRLTQKSLWQALPLEMSFLTLTGAIRKQQGQWRTTEFGQFLALKMFSGFLAGMDYLREQAQGLVPANEELTLDEAMTQGVVLVSSSH